MNSLKEFRAVLTDWQSLGPYLFLGSTAAPLTDLILKMGPPWPAASPVLFCLLAGVTNVAAFHVLHAKSPGSIDRNIRLALGLLAGSLLLYLLVWGTLTVQVPAHEGRIPVGWIVQPGAQRAIEELGRNGVPGMNGPADFLNLRIAGGLPPLDVPLEIWVPFTVHASRFALIVFWASFSVGFVWTSIGFTLYHRRKRAQV